VLGFYLRLVDMSSPQSETEWINLSIGPSYIPPRRVLGLGRVELDKCGTIPARRIAGYQWGSGRGETTLSERLPCGHTGAFHNSGVVTTAGGRFEG
jgi:hypothetical protein